MGGTSRISSHLGLPFHRTLMSEFLYLSVYELACLYTKHHAAAVCSTFLESFHLTKVCTAYATNLAAYLLDSIIHDIDGSLCIL